VEDKERKEYILRLLKTKGTMSTDEIVVALEEYNVENPSPGCHESTVLSLISMKRKKIVSGLMNRKKRTWEWSLA
jgi:hypothetical protein